MKRIERAGVLPMLAAALLTASAAAAETPRAGAAAEAATLFASLPPLENLGAITGKAGISDKALSDNLIQINVGTLNSAVSALMLGNADAARASSSNSTAIFATGGVQASFSGLGGANAIAINTGIASAQTQSVNVNLAIGAVGASLIRTR